MNEEINKALEYWKNKLCCEYGEKHIFNITLYGSQNYNIDTPLSDIDVKAIYIPSPKEAILKHERLSSELWNNNDEICDLKDIRGMCEMYKKQNINFLETLFTPYRWENPMYKGFHALLKSKAEEITRYDTSYGVISTCGQALHSIRQLKNNYNEYKKIAKLIFLHIYLKKYTLKKKYQECLTVNDDDMFFDYPAKELIISLKMNDFDNLNPHIIKWFTDYENVDTLLSFFEKNFKIWMTYYTENKSKPNKEIEEFLNDFCYNTIMSLK